MKKIVRCEVCGTKCHIVGQTTLHYEPVIPSDNVLRKIIDRYYYECGGITTAVNLIRQAYGEEV